MNPTLPSVVVDDLPVCGAHPFPADGSHLYAIDSRGQVWSVGRHGGVLYKTQTRPLSRV